MSPCELTASITAVANAFACKLTNDELTLLGTVFTQLGDTLQPSRRSERSALIPTISRADKEWFGLCKAVCSRPGLV